MNGYLKLEGPDELRFSGFFEFPPLCSWREEGGKQGMVLLDAYNTRRVVVIRSNAGEISVASITDAAEVDDLIPADAPGRDQVIFQLAY